MVLNRRQFAALTLARYEFRLQAQEETVLLSLLGSTLRGAFGHAWKIIMCAAQAGERAECFLREVCQKPGECQYSFFKSTAHSGMRTLTGELTQQNFGDIPRSYIFQPPIPPLTREISTESTLKVRVLKNGVLPFRLTLLDRERQNLLYIFLAVSLMAKRGLGVTRVPFMLERVSVLDENDPPTIIYTPRAGQVEPHAGKVKGLDELVEKRLRELTARETLTLRFLTPTRIRIDGKVKGKFTFESLIGNLSRRLRLLANFYGSRQIDWDHGALLEKARRVVIYRDSLWRHKADRYSESQQEKIGQGGLLGEITFCGAEIQELLPLMVAGEFLHVGSGTSYGLGCYRIEA